MTEFNRRIKRNLDDYYDVILDICEAHQEGRTDFKPKDIVKSIQDKYYFSDSLLHKFVMANYVCSMLEMRKIKRVSHGLYKFI